MRAISVLLVEDNPADRMLAEELVRSTNPRARITTAKDGEEAVNIVERWTNTTVPDLVLLDLNLPKKNGHEILEHIRAKSADVMVIIFTGSTSEKDRNRANQLKATEYMVKPMGIDEIDQTVARMKELLASLDT